MDNDLKYVIVVKHDLEVPIIFPDIITHGEGKLPFGNVVAAGFCRIETEAVDTQDMSHAPDGVLTPSLVVSCYGSSTSLDIKSRGKVDAEIIKMELNRWIPKW